MATMQSPGVYVQRKSASAGPVQGVSTSTLGICGWLPRGPVGEATLVTSWTQFVSKFGDYWSNSYVHYALAGFFNNEGSSAYVVREVPSDAVKASGLIEDSDTGAMYTGRVLSDPVTSLDTTHYNITVSVDGEVATTVDVTGDAGVTGSYSISDIVNNINTALVAAWGAGYANVAASYTIAGGPRIVFASPTTGSTANVTFSAPASAECSLELLGIDTSDYPNVSGSDAVSRWDLTAANEGVWGNLGRLRIYGDDNYRDWTNGGWTKFKAEWQEESSDGAGDWSVVEQNIGPFSMDDANASDYFVDVLNDASDHVVASLAGGGTVGIPQMFQPAVRSNEFLATGNGSTKSFSGTLLYPEVVRSTLTITDGTYTATDQGDGTLAGTGIVSGTINYSTGAWSVEFSAAPASAARVSASYTSQALGTEDFFELSGGADGTGPLTTAELTSSALESSGRGIYAFDKVDEILIVSVPDLAGDSAAAADLIAWADTRKSRFVILDPDSGLTPTEAKEYKQVTLAANTYNGAIYYPWVKVSDPLADGRPKLVPPSAFVAGTYARTDSNRNVGKAPAGVNDGKINGILGFERQLMPKDGFVDILNPAGVNALVDSKATGRCVWGARTLSLDSQWRYINVSRLFMFLEQSIYGSTQWVAFENNGPGLWGRIFTQVDSFMGTLYRDGYFAGTTEKDAYLVVVDSSNNPQSDIDQGIVNIDVYVAPNKPAEFVRFRFQQKTADAQ